MKQILCRLISRQPRLSSLLTAITVAAVLITPSQQALALGLGDIAVTSNLNERFAAIITINNNEELTEDEILVSLGDQAAFDRAGIEREFILTRLKFTPVLSDGNSHIVVSSDESIREPFLNFVLHIQWPKGQMFKEYTVLLNPK